MKKEDFKQYKFGDSIEIELISGAIYSGTYIGVKARTKEGRKVDRLFINNLVVRGVGKTNESHPRESVRSWEINKVLYTNKLKPITSQNNEVW